VISNRRIQMKEKKCAVYVRVSTADKQSTALQEHELRSFAEKRGWKIYRLYADKGESGAKVNRPALDEMWSDCRKRKVDIVLVWSLDRLARSLRQLIEGLEECRRLGIDFVSLKQEGMDTTSSSGRLLFHVIASVAEFERDLIRERVKAGLAEAKRCGKQLGRPAIKRLSHKEAQEIRAARKKGVTLRKLATQFGASLWAMHQAAQG
jgi:DNA invertase Pin-like site-specific DNA recombinase